MLLTKSIHGDYTISSMYYQLILPLNLEISIPSDDPVCLLSAFVEEMDLSELYKTYDRIRKNQASPRQMLKIVLYAAMNRIYSSRDIQKACKRDINFMYLLEEMPVKSLCLKENPFESVRFRRIFVKKRLSPSKNYLLMRQPLVMIEKVIIKRRSLLYGRNTFTVPLLTVYGVVGALVSEPAM